MSPFLLLVLITVLLTPPATSSPDTDALDHKLTPYEALALFDFPVGIIPKGVLGYTLDNSTGDFTAWLSATCEFKIQNQYNLRYQTLISGRVEVDRMSNLKGVQVKILFFWLNIVEVVRRGDTLQFSVGIASADFGIEDFLESPTCGCGFDCGTNESVSGKSCGNDSGFGKLNVVAGGDNARKILRQI